MSISGKIGLALGLLGAAAGICVGIYFAFPPKADVEAAGTLKSRLDGSAKYCIIASKNASKKFTTAIKTAEEMHPDAEKIDFSPDKLEDLFKKLKAKKPRYALVFICPEELDVNFAWKWLKLSASFDLDPFVDIRTGFITGQTPEAAAAFMKRIQDAASGKLKLPAKMIDNLGANPQARLKDFNRMPGSFMIPVYQEKMGVETITHGRQGFSTDKLDAMNNAGILHTGGHGYPDRIVDSMNGVYVRRLAVSPSVVFNGACYTGVTGKWFDMTSGILKEKSVKADTCYALGILLNNVVAYLAALHLDHGIPVYQEMEFMAFSGKPLGDVIKHTYDGVVMGNGGRMPELPFLSGGLKLSWTPKEIMLFGTAARVLYGDPAFAPTEKFADEPLDIQVSEELDNSLEVRAILKNPKLKSTFTDTFHSDMSETKQFNDRALLKFELSEGWTSVSTVDINSIEAGGTKINGKIIGFAVENDSGKTFLHVQVDMPSTGYQQSPFRVMGAEIFLSVVR